MENRYLVYHLLGRDVNARLPMRFGGGYLTGVVDKVCRNIFKGVIEITLDGKTHEFKEPSVISSNDSELVFLYGDLQEAENYEDVDSDFDVYHESLYDYLHRTSRTPVSYLVFRLGDQIYSPRYRWRNRLVV